MILCGLSKKRETEVMLGEFVSPRCILMVLGSECLGFPHHPTLPTVLTKMDARRTGKKRNGLLSADYDPVALNVNLGSSPYDRISSLGFMEGESETKSQ